MQYAALIITAPFEELFALLEVTEDLDWTEESDPDGFRYHFATLSADSRRKLRIAAAWARRNGGSCCR